MHNEEKTTSFGGIHIMAADSAGWARKAVVLFATTLALLWPAFVNGGPFWFPDTSTYIRGADAAVVHLLGSPSEWSDRLVEQNAPRSKKPAVEEPSVALGASTVKPTRPIFSGRSIYYGFLIYLPMRLLGVWGAILCQAMLTAAAILWCLGVIAQGADHRRKIYAVAGIVVICFMTPLPYYVAMLMPDVFAGVIVAVLTTLLVFHERIPLYQKVLAGLSSAAMATFHTSFMLLAIVCTVLVALSLVTRKGLWKPLVIGIPIVLIAILANVIFTAGVARALNKEPIAPPFLSARLIADGPGVAFLDRECQRDPASWTLCLHRAKLPMESDEFLWSDNPTRSVFGSADEQTQRRLAREDKRFFVNVFADAPLSVLRQSLAGTFKVLTDFRIINFNYDEERVQSFAAKLPPEIAAQMAETRAAHGEMPVHFQAVLTVLSTLASLSIIVLVAARSIRDGVGLSPQMVRMVAILVLACLANAAICGALSSPTSRYQMRLIWLVPFAAIAAVTLAGNLRRFSTVKSQEGAG